MKAVIMGAGRIGCGFAGQLLHESGYEITFVTRSPEVVENLNRNERYQVVLTSASENRAITVSGFKAIRATETARVVEAIAEADVIATAVCAQNLPAIAPLIAQGLSLKGRPANVIGFENMENLEPYLRELVARFMPSPEQVNLHGFSGTVISRMVPQRVGNPADDAPLTFIGETVEHFIVDRTTLRAPLPQIKGMIAADNYYPWLLRKLYTFSTGHATAAYLGWLKGYHYIHTAIRDAEIRTAVMSAMEEGQRGLAACFGKDFAGDAAELEAIVARLENAAINDPVARVARDPLRKLGAKERLVGAARLAEAAGVVPQQLALVTAAAFCFGNAAAANGPEMRDGREVAKALNQVCGLDAAHGFGRRVVRSWTQLAPSLLPGNLLLSLQRKMWSHV